MVSQLKSAIVRILKERELSGYSIYKVLLAKGYTVWPNHVYVALAEMEKKERLLESRWVGNREGGGRRHLYLLSPAGRGRYDDLLRDSLHVLMERFFDENLSFEDLPFHIDLVRKTLGALKGRTPQDSFRLVIAAPSYHPLVCFPKYYYAVSQAYPNASVYVVRSPWEDGRLLHEGKNLTFLEGTRDRIPLRDGFADYSLVQGFPRSSSIAPTIEESRRILRDDGSLLLEVPEVLTEERRVPHNTVFPEYALRLFYELCGQDRSVKLRDVGRVLSTRFKRVRSVELRGKVIFHATGRTSPS